jgi:MSHA biogenesis protein MshI
MYAVVARRGKVLQLIDLLTSVGLELDIIDIPEMALRNLAARLPEDGAGVALIAFDRGHGLMTVTRQGALYFSRRLDCGSDRLAEAGEAGSITPTLEGLLDSLTIEIQRSLDFYERHFSQAAIAGIVLTPVPGLTAEVCQYLQAQLGVPTRWLDMATEAAVDGEMDSEALLHCTPVIGASLREDRVEF